MAIMLTKVWLTRLTLLATLVPCPFGGTAAAQQPSQAQANAIRQSCRGDYQAHCASVPTGGHAALQCLKDNLPNLSPSCQVALGGTQGATPYSAPATQQGAAPARPPPMSLREEATLMRQSCGGDFRAFCQGVGLGGGRALACLADHSESLSEPCRQALAAARGR